MTDLEHEAVMQALAEAQPGWLIEQRNAPQTITERRTYHGPGVIDTGKGGVLIDPPIPRPVDDLRGGEDGEDGAPGDPGENGLTPTFSINPTLEGTADVAMELTPDSEPPNYELTFTVPKGDPGDNGIDGKQVEIGIDSESIAWRYTTPPDEPWTPLVLLEDLKGDKGDPGDNATLPSGTAEGEILVLSWDNTAMEWNRVEGFGIETIKLCIGGVPTDYDIITRVTPTP